MYLLIGFYRIYLQKFGKVSDLKYIDLDKKQAYVKYVGATSDNLLETLISEGNKLSE